MTIKFNGQLFTTEDGKAIDLHEAAGFSDYARSHKLDNALPDELLANAERAAALLKAICAKLGCGATVTSFFRCPTLNKAIGGKIKPPSAHMDGRAVDSIPTDVKVQEAFDTLKDLGDELGFDQLIIEHDRAGHLWLHSAVAKDGVKPRKMAFALEKQPVPDRHEKG